MKTIDTGIAALARLDKTPEQVMAQKREELEEEIRVLQQRTWFERYADWRVKQLDDDDQDPDLLTLGLIYRSFELVAFAMALITSWHQAWWGGAFLEAIHLVACIFAAKKEKLVHSFLLHLFYTLILPLMPLIIAVDIKVSKRDRNKELFYKRTRIRSIQEDIAKLTPHEVVPSFYAQGIEEARAELLGDSSELRKAERELRNYLEKIKADKETFGARLKSAGDDSERVDVLGAALEHVSAREANLVESPWPGTN